MKVYFDNAATTRIHESVLAEMMPFLTENFGNASSIHEYGRKAKSAIEKSRKIVAKYLNASTAEIFFTSCGTESNNMVIKESIYSLGVKRIITAPIEHHCVLHSANTMNNRGIETAMLSVNEHGEINLEELEHKLSSSSEKTLVSIMHANNEIGIINDIDAISNLCQKYNALFHSDTVQTIAHFPFDLQKTQIDFISGSAHKFHGPKGIGFVYINSKNTLHPFIDGGAQERNMRAGTENVAGIIGLGAALELWMNNLEQYKSHISSLKSYMIEKLKSEISNITFNGRTDEKSLYHVLSVSLPENNKTDLLLFNLDIKGVCASGGSACASGSVQASHVMEAINAPLDRRTARFSFSIFNTKEEIDFTVACLKEMV
jgi:cysteine desulfurase